MGDCAIRCDECGRPLRPDGTRYEVVAVRRPITRGDERSVTLCPLCMRRHTIRLGRRGVGTVAVDGWS